MDRADWTHRPASGEIISGGQEKTQAAKRDSSGVTGNQQQPPMVQYQDPVRGLISISVPPQNPLKNRST